jgi:hypothetical protein
MYGILKEDMSSSLIASWHANFVMIDRKKADYSDE